MVSGCDGEFPVGGKYCLNSYFTIVYVIAIAHNESKFRYGIGTNNDKVMVLICLQVRV